MASKTEFIQLNGYLVKDDEARRYITQIRNVLGYLDEDGIDNPGAAKSERLDSIEKSIYELETYLRLNDDDLLEDRLSTLEKQVDDLEYKVESNDTSTTDRMDNMQEQIDNIHDHENKAALDIITEGLIDTWNNKSDFSGKYEDLQNLPDLFSGKYEDLENKPKLFSGKYEDLVGKPEGMASQDFVNSAIPKKVSQLENDVPYFSEADMIDTETFYKLVNKFIFMPEEENLTGKNDSNEGRPDTDNTFEGDGSLNYKGEDEDIIN